jgi:hypothetical protein
MLTSRIESSVTPAIKPFTFPGIFRHKELGTLFVADPHGSGIRIASGGGLRLPIGERYDIQKDAHCYVQVTTPVTITFNPQS